MDRVTAKIRKSVCDGMPGEVLHVSITVGELAVFGWSRYERKGVGPIDEPWYRDLLIDQVFELMRQQVVDLDRP